jgi:hypothetical protein
MNAPTTCSYKESGRRRRPAHLAAGAAAPGALHRTSQPGCPLFDPGSHPELELHAASRAHQALTSSIACSPDGLERSSGALLEEALTHRP